MGWGRSRWTWAATALLPALAAGYLTLRSPPLDVARLAARAGRYHVRILRDTWGVPHVFGRTDPDVAYGLAYAHSEDDFPTIQGALLAARGELASVYGREAAPNDYMVRLLRVHETVEARYGTDLRPETQALCDAYAAGVNHYAALHPREALARLYPVSGKDVVAGFVHKLPLFYGIDRTLKELFGEGSPTAAMSPGSNAFAVAPARSADGHTRLAVNSHQPWEGPVAWYEVHLHSDEGWDAAGGLFPGAPVVLHGHNRTLGWAHTVNRPDLIDVYVLQTDPANPDRYRFDGGWRTLEKRAASIRLRLLGPLSWTVEREVLASVHGPVVRRPHGTYALRLAGAGEVRQIEQWYRMNRATSLEDWLAAMRTAALPMFNTVYADAAGNLFYVYNARLPQRRDGFDWRRYLPGDTSEALWADYLPFDALPQVLNPPSGFVQSCNSSPFRTTEGPGNPDPGAYPARLGIETAMTNRALRALELFGGDPSITREEFHDYKYDMAYSTRSPVADALRRLLGAPRSDDPIVREAVELLRGWDLGTQPDNTRTALAVLTLRPDDHGSVATLEASAVVAALREVALSLKRDFGRIDPPWKDVNRLRRGTLDLGIGGAPDVLHAVYGRPGPNGRLVGEAGDSYVMLVEWDAAGHVRSQSIQPYGSAPRDRASRHFADQARLFVERRLKPVWMDEADIRAHLEREYRPGEEPAAH